MDKKKCTNCGKELDLDIANSFKTCMHNQMHRYVCDSKCMREYYGVNGRIYEKHKLENITPIDEPAPTQQQTEPQPGQLCKCYDNNNNSFKRYSVFYGCEIIGNTSYPVDEFGVTFNEIIPLTAAEIFELLKKAPDYKAWLNELTMNPFEKRKIKQHESLLVIEEKLDAFFEEKELSE